MCTLSWLSSDHGYTVFFNRDELKTRLPEQCARPRNAGGMDYIAPADGNSGGTWIAVNACGLTLCLLNLYTAERSGGNDQSRGMIVPSLMHARSLSDVARELRSRSLSGFRPFRLAGFDLRSPVILGIWDGRQWTVDERANDRLPVVSSSFQTADVEQYRREHFQRMLDQRGNISEQMLEDFHRSRHPDNDAYSVCMQRPDARTMSFCSVSVSSSHITFTYEPDPARPAGADRRSVLNMRIRNLQAGAAA